MSCASLKGNAELVKRFKIIWTFMRSYILATSCFCAYLTYYAFVLRHDWTKTKLLTLILLAVIFRFVVYLFHLYSGNLKIRVKELFRKRVSKIDSSKLDSLQTFSEKWIHAILLLCYGNYVLIIAVVSVKKLLCLIGAVLFLVLALFTSAHPHQVDWKSVNLALAAQMLITWAATRSSIGFEVIEFVFREVSKVVFNYSSRGAAAVYGDPSFLFHPNTMYVTCAVTSVVCFITVAFNILRRMDLLKCVCLKLWNINIHCFVWFTCEFYGVASAFTLTFSVVFGVQLKYIISGVAMYIPGVTVLFLISYPKDSNNQKRINSMMRRTTKTYYNNIFAEAAVWTIRGFAIAWTSTALFLAWTSLYKFLDSVLLWMGSKTGAHLSINTVFGILIRPLTTVIGVEWEDSMFCGKVIAEKVLGVSQSAVRMIGHATLSGEIQTSSIASLTHACLGFSSIGWYCVIYSVSCVLKYELTGNIHFPLVRTLFMVHLSGLYIAAVGTILLHTDLNFEDLMITYILRLYGLLMPKHEEILSCF